MSNLTDLLPAGAGGKQVSFVASGTIGNGVTVGLNSDGTVTAVSGVTEEAGSPTIFESARSDYVKTTYDSTNNKIIIAYSDQGNSNYGTAVVGTVSGTSISFGTPTVFISSDTQDLGLICDSTNNKVVIAFKDAGNSDYGTAVVGTVSGTSISFGTATVFESANSSQITAVFDSVSDKIVIAYKDFPNSKRGTVVVGTVSGTSISFGSATIFSSGETDNISGVFDSANGKVVLAYRNESNSGYGTAIVGTVSGTSISFGTAVVFESAAAYDSWSAYDFDNEKIIITYRDAGNSNYGTAVVGTVSGTSISFGTPVVFVSAVVLKTAAVYASNNAVVVAYVDNSNSSYGTVVTGSINGSSISFGSPLVFEDSSVNYTTATYDSTNNKTVIAYRNDGNLDYGTAVVFQAGFTNNTDFIGISDAAISDTASGSVTIKGGISTNVTGLTPNATYYVQDDGSLSTTESDVLAGKALSSTSINLDYTT